MKVSDTLPAHARIVIVGAGFAGIGTAIRLLQAGIDDFVVLERAADVGGTWRDNHYPGCQCDVPSNLYSFSFAPNPHWTRTFAPQAEIHEYLRRCAFEHGVVDHIHFGHGVVDATWVDEAAHWRLTTGRGEMTADVVVLGTGALSEPATPDFPGLDTFDGKTMHTAAWDHEYDLTEERVAVIGTGASAIQVVPEIQPMVDRLVVFQRTAPWIMPHPDRQVSSVERRLFKTMPWTQRLARNVTYWGRELYVLGFVHAPAVMHAAERISTAHMHQQVHDPALREKLTPNFSLGCKRVLLSNKWYPALSQDNVRVESGSIAEIRPRSIVTTDGNEHTVETIIFATGFHVTDHPIMWLVHGRGGRTLADCYRRGAYRGTTAAGFPNLFIMMGPNTGLGHSSMVFMMESQMTYLLDALRTMDRRKLAAVEPRTDVVERYNARLQERLADTVWMSGCSSWYLDDDGNNRTLWPGFTWQYRLETVRFDADAYELTPVHDPVAVPAAEGPDVSGTGCPPGEEEGASA